MALMKILLLFSFLASIVHGLPADPTSTGEAAPSTTTIVAYLIDFFLARKELQYALHDIISFKEATTSRLDPLPNPPTDAENEIRWILEGLRVTAFYAYDKLIFLANAKELTLTYATQTFTWYDNVFNHFTDKIRQLIVAGFDDSVKVQLLSLLDQIVSQTQLHHYNVKLLLTT